MNVKKFFNILVALSLLVASLVVYRPVEAKSTARFNLDDAEYVPGEVVVVFADSECVGTIDLFDIHSGTAFQLRVFGEAPQNDFYEEVLKVVIYNQNTKRKIKKLVFITRTNCAKELNKGLGKALCSRSNLFGFQIEIIGIGGEEFE